MKILITGGTGLVGSRLVEILSNHNFHINIVSRSKRNNTDHVSYFQWNPSATTMDEKAIEGVDAIINLAGAGIADKRWTNERKKVILESRVNSAKTLKKYLEASNQKPIYIGASAVGYYGDQGDKKLLENDKVGKGFLAEVTHKWEEAQLELHRMVSRHVLLRIGIVLSKNGGALKEILKPAALGSYGYFGNGKAYYSWLHIDDLCGMILESIQNENYNGIYNATAKEPITIKELVRSVKKAKNGIGLLMPVPEAALKLIMGEMTEMLTNSTRVIPQRLIDQFFPFKFDNPIEAIKDILHRKV